MKKNLCLISKDILDCDLLYSYVNNETEGQIYEENSNKFDIPQETYERLAFAFHTKEPFRNIFLNNEPLFTQKDLYLYNKLKACSNNFRYIINFIKSTGVTKVDFLACELLRYQEWKDFFVILQKLCNVTVGASINKTGNIQYGGDWIMESDGENIKNVYFNDDILGYTGLFPPPTPTLPLADTNDQVADTVALGGTFGFNGVDYTTCNVSTNGFIYFESGPILTTHNPLYTRAWKALSPFGGNLKTTATGIVKVVDSINKTCTFTFNCYSDTTSLSNTLVFSIVIFFSDHLTRSNQVDYVYTSSTSRTSGFSGKYYIGYSDAVYFRYAPSADTPSTISSGSASVSSTNIFPPNNTTVSDVLNITPTSILTSADDGVAVEVPLGGSFTYGGGTYTAFQVTSNGMISFGEYMVPDSYNGFEYASYRVLQPFTGNLATTSAGITVATSANICTITFNCYSSNTNTLNLLVYSVVIYLNAHVSRSGQIDYVYTSSTSRTTNFSGNYYIGYSYTNAIACCQSVDSLDILIEGVSKIRSNNIFPADNSSIINVLGVDLTASGRYLVGQDDTEKTVQLGGTFRFGDADYTSAKINTDGFMQFGLGTPTLHYPLNNSSLKILSPYALDMVTTLDGITVIPDTTNKKCTIEFNCYNYYVISNIFVFQIILYYSDHPTRSDEAEFYYVSATSRAVGDLDIGNNIGWTNGTDLRAVTDIDLFTVSTITPGLTVKGFPADGTTYVIKRSTLKWKATFEWNPTITTSFGESLNSKELNVGTLATLTGSITTIPGTASYKQNSASGASVNVTTNVGAGTHIVYAIFTPTDGAKYSTIPLSNSFVLVGSDTIGKRIAYESTRKGFQYIEKTVVNSGGEELVLVTISWISTNGNIVIQKYYNSL